MNSNYIPWLNKLLSYFHCLKDSDDKIELFRSSLCSSECFSPLALFMQIDASKKLFLTLNDFINYLHDSQINFNETSLRKCIHNFDKDGDFRINFDEFLGIILPRKNISLKKKIFSNIQESYCPNYALLEIRKQFCNLLIKELELVNNLNKLAEEITKTKEFTTYQAFSEIVCGDNYITKNNLSIFLKKNGIFYNDSEVKQIMFRIDADDDDKISYNEFKEMFFPITDKIVISQEQINYLTNKLEKSNKNKYENIEKIKNSESDLNNKAKTISGRNINKNNINPENKSFEYFNKTEITNQNTTYYTNDDKNYNSNILNTTSELMNNTYSQRIINRNNMKNTIKNNNNTKTNRNLNNNYESIKNVKKAFLDPENNSLNKNSMFTTNDSNNNYTKYITAFTNNRNYQKPDNDNKNNNSFNNSSLVTNGNTLTEYRNKNDSQNYKESLLQTKTLYTEYQTETNIEKKNNKSKSLDYKYSSPNANKSFTQTKIVQTSTNETEGNNRNDTNYYKRKEELLRKYCSDYNNNNDDDKQNYYTHKIYKSSKTESDFFSSPKNINYYDLTVNEPIKQENDLNKMSISELITNNNQNILKYQNNKSYNNNYMVYKDNKTDIIKSVNDGSKKNLYNLLNDYIEQNKITELKKETLANCEDVTPKKIFDFFNRGVKNTIGTFELYQTLKKLSHNMKPNDIKYIYKKYNKNFDDEFNYNEFRDLLLPNNNVITIMTQKESFNNYDGLSLNSQQKILDLFNQIIEGEKSNEEYRTLLNMSCGNYYKNLFDSLKSKIMDGLLKEDIVNFMSLYGKYLDREEAELLMEMMDKNRDDVIDYNEFVKCVSPKII